MKSSSLVSMLCLLFLGSIALVASTIDDKMAQLETADNTEKAAIMNELAKLHLSVNLQDAAEWALKADMIANQLGQPEQQALAKKYRGTALLYSQSYEEALIYYNDALDLFEGLNDRREMSNLQNNIALVYQDQLKMEEAIEWHFKALKLREQLGDPKILIGSLINLGNAYADIGNAEEAHAYYAKALELDKLTNPEQVSPQLMLAYATNESKRGNIAEAKKHFEEAIVLARQQQNHPQLISAFNNYGNYFNKLADYEQGIQYLNNALEAARLYGTAKQLASISLNIGTIYEQTKQYENAIRFYRSSLNVGIKNKLYDIGIHNYVNIGLAFKKMNEPDSASYYFLKGLLMARQFGSPYFLVVTNNAYGGQLRENGQADSALVYFNEAYAIAREYQIDEELARVSHNLGLMAYDRNDFAKARKYLLESLSLNRKIAFVAAEKNTLEALAEIEERAGNADEAIKFLRMFIALNDSLFNQQKQEQITAVEGKLKYELKEEQVRNQQLLIDQQTSMLKRQNERIVYVLVLFAAIMLVLVLLISRYRMKRDKKAIELEQKQLETEHRLLRSQMNPHFMFNALNSIQAFISDNNTLQAELYLSKFARLMRYYLDSSHISFVSLEEEVNGLRMNIELEQLRMNFSFDFIIEIKGDLEADETELPPMLAQPFVENAIKHGLRNKIGKGLLTVSFKTA
jgi:tetratricopeptide (TPR) repeat protein